MRRLITILATLAIGGAAAAAQAPVKQDPAAAMATGLTINDCLLVLAGLTKLDEQRDVVVNKGKPNETIVKEGYEFSRGGLRLDIAHNIAVLTNIQNEARPAQQKIFYQILRTVPEIKNPKPGETAGPSPSIPAGSIQEEEYQKQMLELTSKPCLAQVTRIRAEDLEIDKNRIPVSTLSLIDKIIDR